MFEAITSSIHMHIGVTVSVRAPTLFYRGALAAGNKRMLPVMNDWHSLIHAELPDAHVVSHSNCYY